MKTLVNKHNPAIRITAPEITTAHPPVSNEGYVYWIPTINQMYSPIDWTLVEYYEGSESDVNNSVSVTVEKKGGTEEYINGSHFDNRFEIIAKAKEHLLRATNIEDAPEEMAVIDNILFRCWQMGWLKKYEEEPTEGIKGNLEEIPSMDLEKEIDKEWKKCNPTDEGMGVETANIHIEAFDMIARHFYELGCNTRKEE